MINVLGREGSCPGGELSGAYVPGHMSEGECCVCDRRSQSLARY